MNDGPDVAKYVRNTAQLIDLCLRVAELIDKETPESVSTTALEMDAQLREIARAVDRLEKAGIQVPDVFRAEKTRLAAALGVQDQATQDLLQLAEGLGSVIREIRSRVERRQPQSLIAKNKIEKTEPDRTSRAQLRREIISSLRALGGRATRTEVVLAMEKSLSQQFLPGDLLVHGNRDGTKRIAWQASASKERINMIRDGLLCSDSPVGVWELTGNSS
ncbi:MAG: hypothetical protein ABTR92_18985 [Candidatus Accumulibacter phosphatis]|uniref:hypothetical protein n=1 Tax=Candidatus Accumulibacter sp. ACC012 TaxID=2823332 RepID=UPI0025C606A1|nr:hypothetical protein [Candidatus Accumulibacter sp. ACC012]